MSGQKRQVHRLPVLPSSKVRKSKDLQWLTPQYSAASIVVGGIRHPQIPIYLNHIAHPMGTGTDRTQRVPFRAV